MSKAAISVFVIGVYLILSGIGFLIMPDTILPLLGIPATTEVWIRILGLLVVLLGYYYVIAAQKEIKDFFNATIPVRLVFFLGILVLVLTKVAYPILIIFGIIDLLGAIWTTWALRKE